MGRPEKFGKCWYRFEANRSRNEGGVRGHTYIHTDGSYLYIRLAFKPALRACVSVRSPVKPHRSRILLPFPSLTGKEMGVKGVKDGKSEEERRGEEGEDWRREVRRGGERRGGKGEEESRGA